MMGMHADDIEYEPGEELFRYIHPDDSVLRNLRPGKVLWETRNGNTIDLCNMTLSHLQYSLAKCKKDNWRVKAIPYLEAEIAKRK